MAEIERYTGGNNVAFFYALMMLPDLSAFVVSKLASAILKNSPHPQQQGLVALCLSTKPKQKGCLERHPCGNLNLGISSP
jgi:hypothetical protein